jgi:hypothetical protein
VAARLAAAAAAAGSGGGQRRRGLAQAGAAQQYIPNDTDWAKMWHLAAVDAPHAWPYGKGSTKVRSGSPAAALHAAIHVVALSWACCCNSLLMCLLQ